MIVLIIVLHALKFLQFQYIRHPEVFNSAYHRPGSLN